MKFEKRDKTGTSPLSPLCLILFLLLMCQCASAFAVKVDVFDIYNAYPNIKDMSLSEFSTSVVNYFGLKDVKPAENTFTDFDGNNDILRLCELKCILGLGDGRVEPGKTVGKDRANIILSRLDEQIKSYDKSYDELFLSKNVTAEMNDASYWISRIPNAYEVLLTKEQIQKLNEETIIKSGTYVVNLENLSVAFNGTTLKKEMSEFKAPAYSLYKDNKEVDDKYWNDIRKNIKNAKTTANMKTSYAVVTSKTCLNAYPTSDMLSDDLSDPEWQDNASAGVNVNEPLIAYYKTGDEKFYYVRSSICDGWIDAESIAICKDKEEWLSQTQPKDFLMVTGDRVFLEPTALNSALSLKMITMASKLPLVKDYNGNELILNRIPQNNYIVKMPMRDKNGNFYQEIASIPKNRDVHVGYLDFTRANIVNQAFKCLGDRYGWGGMMYSPDCSEFARLVYETMGIVLPRNTTWQALTPTEIITLPKNSAEKEEILLNTPAGAIVQFNGHEMIYLGKEGDEFYTINSVSSVAEDGTKKRVRTTVVNTLSTARANGNTWFDDLNLVINPAKGFVE